MIRTQRWIAAATATTLLAALLTAAPRPRLKETYAMRLSSPAFLDGQHIPRKYTCDGADISPPLVWTAPPAGTRSFALICDDPDAPVGTWVHWVIYNLPATTGNLPEMIAPVDTLPDGACQGVNDFRKVGYGGPCPPAGPPHHYHFTLYALNARVTLGPRATKRELLRAMEGHILGAALLIGTYQRAR